MIISEKMKATEVIFLLVEKEIAQNAKERKESKKLFFFCLFKFLLHPLRFKRSSSPRGYPVLF
jgi:hypothetical protein